MKKNMGWFIKNILSLLPNHVALRISKILTSRMDNDYIKLMDSFPDAQPLSGALDSNKAYRILVVRLDAIGDLIWTTAFFRELAHCCPQAEIDVVVRPNVASIVETCPYLHKVYTYSTNSIRRARTEELSSMQSKVKAFVQQELKGMSYDIVFAPRFLSYGSALEGELLTLAVNAQYRVARGYSIDYFEQVRNQRLKRKYSYIIQHHVVKHEAECILDLLKVFHYTPQKSQMEMWLLENEQEIFSHLSTKGDKVTYVAVGLVGSARCRNWPVKKWEQLLKHIEKKYAKKKVCFLLLGGKDAQKSARPLEKLSNVINLTGKTSLRESAYIISQSKFYVGADTGLMQMASAERTPIILMSCYLSKPQGKNIWEHSGANPIRVGPHDVPYIILQPTYASGRCVEQCDFPDIHCIDNISVKSVEDAVDDFLNRNFT